MAGRDGWQGWHRQDVTPPAPWVPRQAGLRNAQAPVALGAPSAVWAESTYVRYTHSYVCLHI